MIKDKILVWQMNRGSIDAIGKMYARYKNDLVSLAASLCKDRSLGEDIVQIFFIELTERTASRKAGSSDKFILTGSLKGYLSVCVANKARSTHRQRIKLKVVGLDDLSRIPAADSAPDYIMAQDETSRQLYRCLDKLPDEQREVIILHTQYDTTFKEIAHRSEHSINTIQSRYRYGMEKLKTMLESELI